MLIGSFANFNFGLRALGENQSQVAQSIERLATGKKINRASDDPSGLIAAEDHKARIYSIESLLKSFAQQESYLGAKEGGLSVINEQVISLNDLVVRAANTGGNSDEENQSIADEITSTLQSIDTIATNTTFKGQSVLAEYTVGSIAQGLDSLATLAFDDPEKAQQIAKESVDQVARTRGAIGNRLKEIDTRRSVASNELATLTDSLSKIQDVDYAKEAAKLVRAQILEQGSLAAIKINRQSAQQVLGLIQSATDQGKSIAARG